MKKTLFKIVIFTILIFGLFGLIRMFGGAFYYTIKNGLSVKDSAIYENIFAKKYEDSMVKHSSYFTHLNMPVASYRDAGATNFVVIKLTDSATAVREHIQYLDKTPKQSANLGYFESVAVNIAIKENKVTDELSFYAKENHLHKSFDSAGIKIFRADDALAVKTGNKKKFYSYITTLPNELSKTFDMLLLQTERKENFLVFLFYPKHKSPLSTREILTIFNK